jgi:ATP adenylyltransferase
LTRTRRVAAHALQTGALRPIETTLHHIEQNGVRFIVRMLGSASGRVAAQHRLQQATLSNPANPNPFLPYDPALFVVDLSPTHLCLLNKYPVVADHLLIVTRTFEAQETLLTLADFEALIGCTREIDGLVFYNSSKVAGASQKHKHLQLAPFPLDPTGVDAPIEAVLGLAQHSGDVICLPDLALPHALCWLPSDAALDPVYLLAAYRDLLMAIRVWDGGEAAPMPYNWLATRRWMLAVPRCAESVEGMPVNGLGFAGSLLVRHDAQLAWLRAFGPLSALAAVSGVDICDRQE